MNCLVVQRKAGPWRATTLSTQPPAAATAAAAGVHNSRPIHVIATQQNSSHNGSGVTAQDPRGSDMRSDDVSETTQITVPSLELGTASGNNYARVQSVYTGQVEGN